MQSQCISSECLHFRGGPLNLHKEDLKQDLVLAVILVYVWRRKRGLDLPGAMRFHCFLQYLLPGRALSVVYESFTDKCLLEGTRNLGKY